MTFLDFVFLPPHQQNKKTNKQTNKQTKYNKQGQCLNSNGDNIMGSMIGTNPRIIGHTVTNDSSQNGGSYVMGQAVPNQQLQQMQQQMQQQQQIIRQLELQAQEAQAAHPIANAHPNPYPPAYPIYPQVGVYPPGTPPRSLSGNHGNVNENGNGNTSSKFDGSNTNNNNYFNNCYNIASGKKDKISETLPLNRLKKDLIVPILSILRKKCFNNDCTVVLTQDENDKICYQLIIGGQKEDVDNTCGELVKYLVPLLKTYNEKEAKEEIDNNGNNSNNNNNYNLSKTLDDLNRDGHDDEAM